MKSCGSCTLRCKPVAVTEIAKPRNRWCVHALKARGCAIYDTRPHACRSFNCLGLTEDGLGEDLRPDRARTVLSDFENASGEKAIIAICDREEPKAWKAPTVLGRLRAAAVNGIEVYAVAGSRC